MKPDPAGAKKLLAQAGYPNGFEFTLDCPNNRYVNDEKICQALVGMWAKAGLQAKLNSIPFANFIPKILNFDSSAYLLGWGVATFDAQYSLQSLVRTKTTGADGNFNQGRISDPKLDTTIDAIKIATDTKARDALLREALVTTRDQHYYVPIHHQLRPWAMKKSVTTVHKADDRPESRFARVGGGV
jgi:peptide/nickel transport system substrate-binding protein